MSFLSMTTELRGSVPKLPFSYAQTLCNRAWRTIRERNLWSFQLFEGQWITPPQVTGVGAATVTQGSPTVTLDADASANLAASLPGTGWSLITQRQFRVQLSGIYNIWSYDASGAGPGLATLTLDRPFAEFSGSGDGYLIFQCYYVPQKASALVDNVGAVTPYAEYLPDFKSWISVRNFQNFIDLYTDRYTRTELDAIDPQRSSYFFPTDVVPYMSDANPASATFRYFMFELWGPPLANYVYQLFGIRRGLDLNSSTNPTLPIEVGEDCVMALARVYAYEWAEANKDMNIRSSGPDYKFLMGAAQKEYDGLLRLYRQQDREKCDQWFFIRRSVIQGKIFPYYNSTGSTAYPGAF